MIETKTIYNWVKEKKLSETLRPYIFLFSF